MANIVQYLFRNSYGKAKDSIEKTVHVHQENQLNSKRWNIQSQNPQNLITSALMLKFTSLIQSASVNKELTSKILHICRFDINNIETLIANFQIPKIYS